jgi:Uma2 family endonuclease
VSLQEKDRQEEKMATVVSEPDETLADLVHQLGDIPLERIRLRPAPGTATEADVIAALEAPRKRICELVDGVLVEKPPGTKEGFYAGIIVQWMWNFVERRDLGVVIPADGPLRLWLGLVRIPDVSFISWARIPGEEFPDTPIARLIPNLAVEVLSKSNTRREMERKPREYFQAGVELVWLIDPKTRTAQSYTSAEQMKRVDKDGTMDGGNVLPGFKLSLPKLFARTSRRRKRG